MSSVLVESPVAAGQLYFPWSDSPADHESVEPEAASPQAIPAWTATSEAWREETRGAKPLAGPVGTTGPLESLNRSDRVAQPVRIGTVMIKLLKRYGITDQEIAAGLDSYARRTCQQAAS